jgi:hypothetical protein
MDHQSERELLQRELKARIKELATGLLQVIAGTGSSHEVACLVEQAAHSIRQHVDAGGSAEKLIAQALGVVDAIALADTIRNLGSSDEDRASIETLHDCALSAIRTGALREVAAVLEGSRIKSDRARQQVLFGVNAFVDAQELRREFFGEEAAHLHH